MDVALIVGNDVGVTIPANSSPLISSPVFMSFTKLIVGIVMVDILGNPTTGDTVVFPILDIVVGIVKVVPAMFEVVVGIFDNSLTGMGSVLPIVDVFVDIVGNPVIGDVPWVSLLNVMVGSFDNPTIGDVPVFPKLYVGVGKVNVAPPMVEDIVGIFEVAPPMVVVYVGIFDNSLTGDTV